MDISFVTHGLIIDAPWIDLILTGEKVWEMRSTATQRRGPIALIRKGSKQIVGVAYLQETLGPFNIDELDLFGDRHHIPPSLYRKNEYKWHHAWLLKDIEPLAKSIPYKHKLGAVIWVELDPDALRQLADYGQISKNASASNSPSREPLSYASSVDTVPFARDGSFFCEDTCLRKGGYTVGEKGDEQHFDNFQNALNYLEKMPTAKWRRPNPKGNWGIVSATNWAPIPTEAVKYKKEVKG